MDSSAFALTPTQQEIVDAAREFGEKWAPLATEIDRDDKAPTDQMIADTVTLGLSGLTIPEEFGGRGHSAIEFALAVEQACRSMKSWMAGDILFATTCTGPSVIMMSDNTKAHANYLPKIASGERTAAIALSEPKYGSAVTDIETSAVIEGDEIRIDGSKRFITGAPDYDVYVVFVRLNGIQGMKGIGAVVVDKDTPGFTLGTGPEYMGSRGSPHGDLHFENCRVPAENLLMGEGSFAHLMQAFNMERLYISSLCLGLAQGAFDEAVAYSNEREQFGRPINEFQAVYHMVAEMWTQIESVRYLTYK
ncbi:MAG TPA: acyl-CoA dehydrogenase family protein, partial [Mycobacterium sp.]|nr:acyl-CoA dehydrogenase family protein [Mycobacterium sp.]